MDSKYIYQKVQEQYGAAAKGESGAYARKVATAFGYTEDELATIPLDSNLGLSCGNPLALAKLREGETVIDLGSGAGFDVFLAAKRLGPSGKAIGVDMNKDMLARANQNKINAQADNVLFVESSITNIPISNESADCIISNCVINLVPEQDKHLVFNEMFRLLKSGGRVAISDILIKRQLPQELKDSMALYIGCVAGASLVTDYDKYLKEAGFSDVLIVDSKNDLNVYTSSGEDASCCGERSAVSCCQKSDSCCSTKGSTLEKLMAEFKHVDFNEWAGMFCSFP
ncbi:arsenite methyltransferase [Xylogone sp. PMI_703]|nr:arsenite methyltransferase [Xylogone sp. PMI_703]